MPSPTSLTEIQNQNTEASTSDGMVGKRLILRFMFPLMTVAGKLLKSMFPLVIFGEIHARINIVILASVLYSGLDAACSSIAC